MPTHIPTTEEQLPDLPPPIPTQDDDDDLPPPIPVTDLELPPPIPNSDKESLINYAEKTKNNNLLEARFAISSNDQFHKIGDSVKKEIGSLEPRRIFFEWEEWLKKMIKMKKI